MPQSLQWSYKFFLIIILSASAISISLYGYWINFSHTDYKHNNKTTNINIEQHNASCAESILNWCKQNNMPLSNCSWTVGTFHSHFYRMAALINRDLLYSWKNATGVAFIRFGDGEILLMLGQKVVTIDAWVWPGGNSRIGDDLRSALMYPKYQSNAYSPFYIGIYDTSKIYPFHELLTVIKQHPKYLTYANLFVNSNYLATKLLYQSIIQDEPQKIVLIIGNQTTPQKRLELEKWASDIIQFPTDGVKLWENNDFRGQAIAKIVTLAKRYRNHLFAFSIGPLTKALIYFAWLENPYNRYIDFGSALDELTKSQVTREYQKNAYYYHDSTYILHFDALKHRFSVSTVD
jgi:hypothetical protein